MTVNYTSLLGLALPVTGTEAGAWGDVVNNYLTSYLDASVAGTQTITGSQTAVTLAVTNGATLVTVGSGATGSAQFQIITCTGNPASLLTITAPASSRQYIIINSTSTSQSVQIVGAGPTTGVTIVSGEKAHVAWNGSDFVKIATQNGNGDFVTVDTTNLEVTNIKAKDGTASMTLADSTGVVTVVKDQLVNGVTVGRGAGAVSTNTAVGASALAANTTGNAQIAIGTQALRDNTTGTGNTAVGHQSMIVGNGSYNAAVGGLALNNLSSGSNNVAVGYQALQANTTASNNTAVGYQAGYGNQTGTGLTFVGHQAGYASASGAQYNMGIGYQSLYGATGGGTTGIYNTAVGSYRALYNNTTGSENSAFGMESLLANTTGAYNTAIGKQALASNTTASNNTAVGYQASYLLAGGGDTVAVGRQALYSSTTGSENTAVGSIALYSNTTGNFNVAVGRQALYSNTTASYNTAVGYQAGYGNTTGTLTALGTLAGYSNTTGSSNTAIGGNNGSIAGSLQANTTGSYNIAVGTGALASNTTASTNTAVGYQAGYSNTTGYENDSFGTQAGYSYTTTNRNTSIGTYAGRYQTGYYNTFVGAEAGNGVNGSSTANTNVGIGAQALSGVTTGSNNVAIGGWTGGSPAALAVNTSGAQNIAIGSGALGNNTTASNNTAVGYQAGYSNVTGTQNALVGYQAGHAATGNYLAALGYQAGYNNTNADDPNVAVGWQALYANTSGGSNTAIGGFALKANTTASYNTAVGYQAGYSNTTGAFNLFVGRIAGYSNTTASAVTAVGNGAAYANTTGTDTTAVGSNALVSNTTGAYNTALGSQSLYNNTTASNNTAVGYQSLYISDPALTNATSLTSGNNGTVYTIISVGSTDFTAIGAASNTAGITFTKSGGTGTGTGTVKQNVDAKNTAIGYGSGSAITTGTKNTIIGSYNGNQDGLDIRTSSNVIVLSDGDGNANFIVRRNAAGGYFLAGPTKSDPSGANYYSTVSADGADVQLILQRTGTGTGWAGIGASGESAFIVYGQGLTSVPFRVKQTDGTVILKDGATAATGTGITFPATQNASSNANTLDDYEEGTWTPTDASGAGLSFVVTGGFYTKVGNLVTCWFELTYPSTSSSASSAIGGLPFASKNVSTYRWSCGAGYNNKSINDLILYGSYNSSQFNFYISNGNGAANSSLSGGLLACTFSYQTD